MRCLLATCSSLCWRAHATRAWLRTPGQVHTPPGTSWGSTHVLPQPPAVHLQEWGVGGWGQGKAGVRWEVSAPQCSSQTPCVLSRISPRLVLLSQRLLEHFRRSLSSLRDRLSVGCFRTVCSPQTSRAVLPRIAARLVLLSQRLREHFYRRLSGPGGHLCFRFNVEEGRGRALTDYQRAHNRFYFLCFDSRLGWWMG